MVSIFTSVSAVFPLISDWKSAIKSCSSWGWLFLLQQQQQQPLGFSGGHWCRADCTCPHTARICSQPPNPSSDCQTNTYKRSTMCRKHSNLPFFHPSAEDWDWRRTDTCHKVWVCMSWLFLFARSFVGEKHSVPLKKGMEKPCRRMFSFSFHFSVSLSLSLSTSVLYDLFSFFSFFFEHSYSERWAKWMDPLHCESQIGNKSSFHKCMVIKDDPESSLSGGHYFKTHYDLLLMLNIFSSPRFVTTKGHWKNMPLFTAKLQIIHTTYIKCWWMGQEREPWEKSEAGGISLNEYHLSNTSVSSP